MMEENPYKAPQTGDHPPKPKVTPNDRWPYLNAIVACLVSATILGVLANLVIAPEFKTTSLSNAVGLGVWVTSLLIGLFAYRQAAKRASR